MDETETCEKVTAFDPRAQTRATIMSHAQMGFSNLLSNKIVNSLNASCIPRGEPGPQSGSETAHGLISSWLNDVLSSLDHIAFSNVQQLGWSRCHQ